MIETDFLRHLNKLSLIINKKVTSNYTGERESIHTGHGLIFKDHRIYTPGDNYKDIDWRVFARTDKLHVKRYEEERNLTVHIIVDASASMNFGSENIKKFEYASMIGTGFAYMAMRNNERFVLSTFAGKLERFKPKRGKKQLVDILDYLKEKKAAGVSKFEDSLRDYARVVDSRSLIVIISDFLYDPEEVKRIIYAFKENDVKLVQVLDPVELKLSLEGEFKLKDMETSSFLRTFISPFLRKSYLSRLEDHVKKLKWIAHSVGATFHTVTSDMQIFDAFFEILR